MFTKVSHDYLDTIAAQLKPTEFMVLMQILRYTEGWGRKSDLLYAGFLARKTGISQQTVSRIFKKLEEKKLILLRFNKQKSGYIVTLLPVKSEKPRLEEAPDTALNAPCQNNKNDLGGSEKITRGGSEKITTTKERILKKKNIKPVYNKLTNNCLALSHEASGFKVEESEASRLQKCFRLTDAEMRHNLEMFQAELDTVGHKMSNPKGLFLYKLRNHRVLPAPTGYVPHGMQQHQEIKKIESKPERSGEFNTIGDMLKSIAN